MDGDLHDKWTATTTAGEMGEHGDGSAQGTKKERSLGRSVSVICIIMVSWS